MDNNFDKEIKKRLSDEGKQVPDNINLIINNTLNSLDSKNKTNYIKVAGVVIATIISLSTIGITATAFSTGIPIKDIIYEIVGLAPEYKDYASDINVAKESADVKYTITSALFDGYKLSIAYKIESDKKDIINGDEEFIEYFPIDNITINGKRALYSGSQSIIPMEDNIVVGVADFDIEDAKILESGFLGGILGLRKVDIIDTFELGIEVSREYEGELGTWEFNIPISSEKIKKQVKEYKVNSDVGSGKITKIVVTPLSVYVDGEFYSIDDEFASNKAPGYILVDEKGKEYREASRNISSKRGKGRFFYEYVNEKKDIDIESFTVIPYKEIEVPKKEGVDEVTNKVGIKLTENGFEVEQEDKSKDIIITDVVKNEENLEFHYKAKYPISQGLWIDSDGYEDGYRNPKVESLDGNQAVLRIYEKPENKTYNLRYNKLEKLKDISQDEGVIIELK